MSTHINKDSQYAFFKAAEFLTELDSVMKDAPDHSTAALNAMDKLHEMLCEAIAGGGYYVKLPVESGMDFDILADMTKEEWDAIVYNQDRDFTNLSTFNVEEAQKLFLTILGHQVLANVPRDLEQARRHVKLQVASLFNGANVQQQKFDLIYLDLVEDSYTETEDIGDLLIVL